MNELTVNQLLEYLEECRRCGMGDAKIVTVDDGDNLTYVSNKTEINVAYDDNGELVVCSMHKGKPAVCFW